MLDRHCPRPSTPIDGDPPRSCLLVETCARYRGGWPNIQIEGCCVRFEPVTQLQEIRDHTGQEIKGTFEAGQWTGHVCGKLGRGVNNRPSRCGVPRPLTRGTAYDLPLPARKPCLYVA